jgi:CheY-like chemotaxis protein
MANILIVDDNANIRMLYSCVFSENHRVIEAADGKEALKLLIECQVDLIITDIYMPVMGGLDFIKAVRTTNTRVKILVHGIFVSHTAEEFLAAGANSCLPKPADLQLLKQLVEELLI